ncbi:hypothetical protein SASPL_137483 [Salvia splendens]|uniref:Uncharacterized protein n=1 Tax=Salvia splendens TaxID=180675 RepID=A0A8X8WTF7_SALSN|nr:hypothetical protein SASPL_137483 [Salvia splendens]
MLKKMMAMAASGVKVTKNMTRAIETRLIIQWLLLRGDKRMVRHLFHRSNHVKRFDIVEVGGDAFLPDDSEFIESNSIATSPASVVQVAEEMDDAMNMEDDYYDDAYTLEMTRGGIQIGG